MTIHEMLSSDKPTLTAAEVAPVLNCDPQFIRIAARTQPEVLGFPVIRIGRRTKIPRIPFLRYMGVEV